MRKEFAIELYSAMARNKDIVVLTGDLGFGLWDKIKNSYPDRFINCGASEQSMLDIAVGLAYAGKIPFVYTITPFFYRAFETIRTYVDHEKLNIKLIGSGRDKDYAHDGFSHDATDFEKILDRLHNIKQFWPETKEEMPLLINKLIEINRPCFVSLTRKI